MRANESFEIGGIEFPRVLSREAAMELQMLRERFIDRLSIRRDAILLALRHGDTIAASRLLHQLEGSSAMYGLDSVTQLVRDISEAVGDAELPSAVTLTKFLCDPELVGSINRSSSVGLI